MQWNDAAGDRRQTLRVHPTGSATIHVRGGAIRARIADLALGGVRLIAAPGSDLHALCGHRASLELRLDGARGTWIHVSGHVLRVRRAHREIVLELSGVPTDFEDLVQDELVSVLESGRATAVLVVDARDDRRSLLAETLRSAGCRVTEARTPLEAIFHLEESRLHVELVAIAAAEPDRADELRRFVNEVHPGVRVVILGTRVHADPPAMDHALHTLHA